MRNRYRFQFQKDTNLKDNSNAVTINMRAVERKILKKGFKMRIFHHVNLTTYILKS